MSTGLQGYFYICDICRLSYQRDMSGVLSVNDYVIS